MFLSIYVSIYLSMYLSIYVSIHLYVSVTVRLCLCLSVCLSFCLSFCLSVYLTFHLWANLTCEDPAGKLSARSDLLWLWLLPLLSNPKGREVSPLHTDPTEKGASDTCGTVMCTLTCRDQEGGEMEK